MKKLEALTAQTTEGSVHEEQMKNFTAKAKERLADVEDKVNKQLTKGKTIGDGMETLHLDFPLKFYVVFYSRFRFRAKEVGKGN